MAIDGIGKGAGAAAGLPPSAAAPAEGGAPPTGATFEVQRADAPSATSAADGASASSALGRLRAGEIDVHGYIDLKVDEATSALHGLSGSELDAIRSVLRDQMSSDPGLGDLVRAATGKTPAPPEE